MQTGCSTSPKTERTCAHGPTAQVAAALLCLDDIEAGYRSFHATMMGEVRSFPRVVNEINKKWVGWGTRPMTCRGSG